MNSFCSTNCHSIEALAKDLGKPREEVHLHEIYPLKAEIRHEATPARLDGATAGSRRWPWSARTFTSRPTPRTCHRSHLEFPIHSYPEAACQRIGAGNQVIVKPSEHTLKTSKVLVDVVRHAVPEMVATVVQGGPEVSAHLAALPFQHICFTGGTAIGKKVMRAAAENLASLTLELGGKSPAVVDATAHLVDASKRMAWGKCLNNGQVCIAPDYALVEERIAEPFWTL